MNFINAALNFIFDRLLFPVTIDLFGGLIFTALATGVVMLLIFKFTSNQEAIRNHKNHLKAHLLEFRLYQDDVGLSLAAMRNLLWINLKYLKAVLRPMLFLSVPTILLLIQLAAWYEHRPLQVGESTIISVKLKNSDKLDRVRILVPEGLKIDTPPLRIPEEKEIDWRVKATRSGNWQISLDDGNDLLSKSLVVADNVEKLAPVRSASNDLSALLYPPEKTLPANSSVEQIKVAYPRRHIEIFGSTTHWLVVFILGSVLAGYSLKGLFKVQV